ncbi:MFS transporter [Companilactobacillus kimchiensis]|uniref:Proton-dependent transporter n=1 Tax=Companilactobacillus kimchiensis TaxID=993692 RepID=A0A0R2KZD6_9LACO|nr:MFS transporter [Companilactobacillus kimchiensis]KRN94904.1 proton-dependent transporter [Companilactobacillus kimchiensis]
MSKEIKLALLMATSLFMEMLDGTIVTTALPKMAQYFNTTMSQISFLVSSYMVATAIFIPLSGWLASRFGNKRIWLIAIVLFTTSSLGSALSPNFAILILMRIIQGFSGALLTPTARLIVLEKTPTKMLLRMTGYFVWPALIAPAIAPVVGGMIITYLSWHWIFLINLPIGIIAFMIGRRMIPGDIKREHTKFDWTGFFEIALASGLIVVGADVVTNKQTSIKILGLGMIVLGILFGYLTCRHLLRANNPLFSLKAMGVKSFRISQTSGSVLWLSVGAMPYLLTIYLQNVFHWSAVVAGTYVIFIFLGNIGIKPFTTIIIKSLTYKGALLSSFMTVLLSSIAFFWVSPTTPAIIIMALAFFSGVGRSLGLTAFNGLILSEISPTDRNSANTLNSVTSSLVQGLGISLVSLLISLLSNFVTLQYAYSFSFIFLGLLMIYPIIEILGISKEMGSQTI